MTDQMLCDQVSYWLIEGFKKMQDEYPQISDGILIVAMARIQRGIIDFIETEESKEILIKNVIGILKNPLIIKH